MCSRRLEVRPGLAGWAQVNGSNAIPWSRRIELDVWYVDHRSVGLDLRILGRALLLAVRGPGASDTGVTTDLDT